MVKNYLNTKNVNFTIILNNYKNLCDPGILFAIVLILMDFALKTNARAGYPSQRQTTPNGEEVQCTRIMTLLNIILELLPFVILHT